MFSTVVKTIYLTVLTLLVFSQPLQVSVQERHLVYLPVVVAEPTYPPDLIDLGGVVLETGSQLRGSWEDGSGNFYTPEAALLLPLLQDDRTEVRYYAEHTRRWWAYVRQKVQRTNICGVQESGLHLTTTVDGRCLTITYQPKEE
jgi:hypothetical protein